MKKLLVISISILLCCPFIHADEGMWMVNSISEKLLKSMQRRGLCIDASEIYNEDSISVKDAIVSLDFMCTGSMISEDGLLITNHHCAYSDVHALSTTENNYLKYGFFAKSRSEEIPIKGKKAYFLRKTIDVTEEVQQLIETEKAANRPYGSRRIASIMNKKYTSQTGLEADLCTMWAGERYYMALYEVYTDIRLVAAPPESAGAFGGDIDNWEWPQQKCDFALYRIYTAPDGKAAEYNKDNVPYHPRKVLSISTKGVEKGDFTMVLGYPGRTSRYSSGAKVAYKTDVVLPITNSIRAGQMQIIKSWMDKDADVRLKYSDKFFSLSNIQECDEGLQQNVKRFEVVEQIRKEEKSIMSSEKELLKNLESKYAAIQEVEKNRVCFRETIIRGTGLSVIATRLKNNVKDPQIEEHYASLDMRVEKELFKYSLKEFFEGVSSEYFSDFHKDLVSRYGLDYDAMCQYLWKDGYMTKADPIYKFYSEISISVFNSKIDALLEGESLNDLNREYTRAKYRIREKRGQLQYPDANSTMRISYGNVSSFKRDGKFTPIHTFASEILEKYDSTSFDYFLLPQWKKQLEESVSNGYNIPVNFISDNDITGGNSGSPVLNANAEIVGLAFDGNKESLASDFYWTKGYNKCLNVDIRFVLWALQNYAGMDYLLDEMDIK